MTDSKTDLPTLISLLEQGIVPHWSLGLLRETQQEIERLWAIESAAGVIINYRKRWPDCCTSMTLDAFIDQLASKYEAAEAAGGEDES